MSKFNFGAIGNIFGSVLSALAAHEAEPVLKHALDQHVTDAGLDALGVHFQAAADACKTHDRAGVAAAQAAILGELKV